MAQWFGGSGRRQPAKRVPAGTRVYAVGDTHGCAERLRELHARILEDAADSSAGRRVIVYLGDYVDRGPDSRQIVELLLHEPLPGFEPVHLKGNHEDMLLRFLEDKSVCLHWMQYGGDATCRSYGIEPLSAPAVADRSGWLQERLRAGLPQDHLDFLNGLRLSHVEGDYLFVHAGVRPGTAPDEQVAEDLMWIREPFLASRADHGKVVVHGHTPTESPVRRRNRIGIDTGACYGGPLTALVLEDAEQRFLQV